MVLTFVIGGESHQVTAEQFRTLIDVAVRLIKDASRSSGVDFTIGSLHASAPTIEWQPQASVADVALDTEFVRVAQRLESGIEMLEEDAGLPDWMAEPTARALYQASALFGETAIDGVVFGRNGRQRKITRQTYRTLDRVLHETTDAIGSITGVMITATLTNGPQLTVRDDVSGRAVRCTVDRRTLRQAAQWIGEKVTAAGHIKRDHMGRPERITNAMIEPLPERQRVTVAEMGGAFEGGPDSVTWLREQRG